VAVAQSTLTRSHRLPNSRPSRRTLASLRYVSLAWAFGATWMYITTGAALTRFAKLLEMPEYGYGFLAALPFAGTLLQLPSSYIVERYGHRKKLFLVSGIIHRALWAGVAAIPFFVPLSSAWLVLLAMVGVSGLAAHVSSPAVAAWLGDMCPRALRGRYFSRRMQLGQFTGLMATVLVGVVLDRADVLGPDALKWSLCALLAAAGFTGTVDFLILAFVKDPPTSPPDREVRFWSVVRVPLADANFRRYLGFAATFTFAVGYIGQYIWLYVFDVVRMNNLQANILLVAVPLVLSMACVPAWGRMIDKVGRRPALTIAGALVITGGAAWILVTPHNWGLGYPIAMISMFGYPGLELASWNLLLGLTTNPTTRRQNSAYLAVNSVVVAIAGVLSGLFGAAIARWLGDWHGPLFGWPLTYHGVLFLISGAGRFLSLFWLRGLRDEGAWATRDAARLVAANLYSNTQQALLLPARRLGRLTRRSYHWATRAVARHP